MEIHVQGIYGISDQMHLETCDRIHMYYSTCMYMYMHMCMQLCVSIVQSTTSHSSTLVQLLLPYQCSPQSSMLGFNSL